MVSSTIAISCALAFSACTGSIGGGDDEGIRRVNDPGGANGDGSNDYVEPAPRAPDDDRPVTEGCEGVRIADSRMRRLLRHEYDNTLRDLLGDTTAPARAFPPDDSSTGFEVGLNTSPLLAEQYFTAAEAAAERAVTNLDALLPCAPEPDDEAACARQFLTEFLPRAFRRDVTVEEIDRFQALYASAATDGFETGIRIVLHAALSSPHFLYHVEAEPDETADAVLPVRGFSMANRLAYFLWSTMPDDGLFALARSGGLESSSDVAEVARAMLADPRARDGLSEFSRQWLGLDEMVTVDKDPAVYPGFTRDVGTRLVSSLDTFVSDVVFEGDGTFGTLMTASHAFVSADIAEFFGATSVLGSGLVRVDLDPTKRAGILSHPAFLAILGKPDQSDPITRGLFVRERLLCQHLPDPPDDVDLTIAPPAENVSTRERFRAHTEEASCQGCHRLIDPIGFGFEHYDGVGRYREDDGGEPVDATGEIVDSREVDGPFDGVPALATKLASSLEAQECMGSQMFQYAIGRPEATADDCSIRNVHDAFVSARGDVRELMVQLTQTDAFLYRRSEGEAEVAP